MRKLLRPAFQFAMRCLPPRIAVQTHYLIHHKRRANIRRPVRFTEKVVHRKIFDRDARLPMMVDKIAVKEFVASRLGSEFVTPTLWSGERLPPLHERNWPIPFVIKTNNGSGTNVFVRNASEGARILPFGRRMPAGCQRLRGRLPQACARRAGDRGSLRRIGPASCLRFQRRGCDNQVQISKSGKARHIALADEGCDLFDDLVTGRMGGELIFKRADGEAWGKCIKPDRSSRRARCEDRAGHDISRSAAHLRIGAGDAGRSYGRNCRPALVIPTRA